MDFSVPPSQPYTTEIRQADLKSFVNVPLWGSRASEQTETLAIVSFARFNKSLAIFSCLCHKKDFGFILRYLYNLPLISFTYNSYTPHPPFSQRHYNKS